MTPMSAEGTSSGDDIKYMRFLTHCQMLLKNDVAMG
jgi:hypothetical protein